MSTTIAIIYKNKMCLASDVITNGINFSTRQAYVNDKLAIAFDGTALIGDVVLNSIKGWKAGGDKETINSTNIDDLQGILTFFFNEFIHQNKAHAMRKHYSVALMIGLNSSGEPEIVWWNSDGPSKIFHQKSSEDFTILILNPPDVPHKECADIAYSLITDPKFDGSLENLTAKYISAISSKSKFVGEKRIFWLSEFPSK